MIQEISFDFGVEEFVVVISLVKKFEEAKGLLLSAFGEISPEEEKGRLMAAYNSLFARGLLNYDLKEATLHPDIKRLLGIFFDSRKLIKSGKVENTGEDALSYYAYQNMWLEHSVSQGIAHRFRYPIDDFEIQKNLGKFFLPSASLTISPTLINIPVGLISNLSPGAMTDYDSVLAILSNKTSNNVLEASQLSADIANGKWRGSTVWIDRPDENRLFSRGYLWIQGKDRLWAINSHPSEEKDLLLATLCSIDDFHSKVKELIFTVPDT